MTPLINNEGEPFALDPATHLKPVVNGLLAGRIVPFLGAGANMCGVGAGWIAHQRNRLPSGTELSSHLANRFAYPHSEPEDPKEEVVLSLAKVAQYVDTIYGRGPLDGELDPLFKGDFSVTSLHEFLATLPSRCRSVEYWRPDDDSRKHFVIVTTNYDNVMENAFQKAGQPFHLITYVSSRNNLIFRHHSPLGKVEEITAGKGTSYTDLDNDEHPILLKIHGSAEGENFVITEDDYLTYLSFGDITSALPMSLYLQLIKSNFLFLGYALQDWNLRAFLVRIWREQQFRPYNSWAVMARSSRFEQRYWMKKNVEILPVDLKEYISRLDLEFAAELKAKSS